MSERNEALSEAICAPRGMKSAERTRARVERESSAFFVCESRARKTKSRPIVNGPETDIEYPPSADAAIVLTNFDRHIRL